MKHKYSWWIAENGMIGKYRKSPGDGWRGPYDSVRDLKAAQQNTKTDAIEQVCAECGGIHTNPHRLFCVRCGARM